MNVIHLPRWRQLGIRLPYLHRIAILAGRRRHKTLFFDLVFRHFLIKGRRRLICRRFAASVLLPEAIRIAFSISFFSSSPTAL